MVDETRINLTEQDVDLLIRLAATEADHGLASTNPEQYQLMVGAIIDTVLNRVASDQFPDTVLEVANQDRQFSAIAGPPSTRLYGGDVRNVPDADVPQVLRDAALAHISDRMAGMPSLVGGGLHYANPFYSTANNMVWINALDGPSFGQGDSIHIHGTTEGYTPTEALLGFGPAMGVASADIHAAVERDYNALDAQTPEELTNTILAASSWNLTGREAFVRQLAALEMAEQIELPISDDQRRQMFTEMGLLSDVDRDTIQAQLDDPNLSDEAKVALLEGIVTQDHEWFDLSRAQIIEGGATDALLQQIELSYEGLDPARREAFRARNVEAAAARQAEEEQRINNARQIAQQAHENGLISDADYFLYFLLLAAASLMPSGPARDTALQLLSDWADEHIGGEVADSLNSALAPDSAPYTGVTGTGGGGYVPTREGTDFVRGTNGQLALTLPVEGTLSSPFGWRNLFGLRVHEGIDIAGAIGTPVFAAAPGTVEFVGESGGYGNLIIIRHDDGSTTRYGHLDEFSVQEGDRVSRDTQIGELGNTGRSTGPHLHFEHRDPDGNALEPVIVGYEDLDTLREGTSPEAASRDGFSEGARLLRSVSFQALAALEAEQAQRLAQITDTYEGLPLPQIDSPQSYNGDFPEPISPTQLAQTELFIPPAARQGANEQTPWVFYAVAHDTGTNIHGAGGGVGEIGFYNTQTGEFERFPVMFGGRSGFEETENGPTPGMVNDYRPSMDYVNLTYGIGGFLPNHRFGPSVYLDDPRLENGGVIPSNGSDGSRGEIMIHVQRLGGEQRYSSGCIVFETTAQRDAFMRAFNNRAGQIALGPDGTPNLFILDSDVLALPAAMREAAELEQERIAAEQRQTEQREAAAFAIALASLPQNVRDAVGQIELDVNGDSQITSDETAAMTPEGISTVADALSAAGVTSQDAIDTPEEVAHGLTAAVAAQAATAAAQGPAGRPF